MKALNENVLFTSALRSSFLRLNHLIARSAVHLIPVISLPSKTQDSMPDESCHVFPVVLKINHIILADSALCV